jgi:hypothetical protein
MSSAATERCLPHSKFSFQGKTIEQTNQVASPLLWRRILLPHVEAIFCCSARRSESTFFFYLNKAKGRRCMSGACFLAPYPTVSISTSTSQWSVNVVVLLHGERLRPHTVQQDSHIVSWCVSQLAILVNFVPYNGNVKLQVWTVL